MRLKSIFCRTRADIPFLLFLLLSVVTCRAQQAGTLDLSFDPGTGIDDTSSSAGVRAIVLQPDGRILLGGNFNSYNGTPAGNLVRLLPDGSRDTTFRTGAGANGLVSSISVQPDGRILIGGHFSSYGGSTRYGVARLHPDGTLDGGFIPALYFTSMVNATLLQPDGKVLAGGNLSLSAATLRTPLCRLLPDGSLDPSFSAAAFQLSPVNFVYALARQPDGRLLVGGQFYLAGMTSRTAVVRLLPNGAPDPAFAPGGGSMGSVLTAVLQPDGKVIIGGNLNAFYGTHRYFLARLHPDGSLDSAFATGTGADNDVMAAALQPDGKLVIAGLFSSYDGLPRSGFCRLLPDGSPDLAFDPGSGPNGSALALAVQPDGNILLAGWFSSYDGTPRNRIARIRGSQYLATTFAATPTPKLPLYPNPNRGTFTLDLSAAGPEPVQVAVFSLAGQPVLQRMLPGASASLLCLEGLADGVYLVRVQLQDQVITRQVLLQR